MINRELPKQEDLEIHFKLTEGFKDRIYDLLLDMQNEYSNMDQKKYYLTASCAVLSSLLSTQLLKIRKEDRRRALNQIIAIIALDVGTADVASN